MSHAIGDREALEALAAGLPARWRNNLVSRLEQKVGGYPKGARIALGKAAFEAKDEIYAAVRTLAAVRVPLDAQDADICARADALADWCVSLGALVAPVRPAVVTFHDSTARRDRLGMTLRQASGDLCGPPAFWPRLAEKMGQVAADQGIAPPGERRGARSACARMMCPLWWRSALRKHHARSVEGTAIALGLVNKKVDIYVSRESLARRQQQNKRNADTLARTVATNEHGQEFTLAELAAKGTANKKIRRNELMTRIAGFEKIARDLGHAGSFITITCPSRMHRWRTVNGGTHVIENPKYDGTTPREAQAYLSALWARARAKLARQKIRLYGFRIAEPQQDATPHWHCLFFHAQEHAETVADVIKHYALQDSPDERGAHARRVDVKAIDWNKGSAAGYIAKYVAKNIDGHALETDLTGEPILTVPARVEAWAATWGIRQFQQVGGPPVTVWREMRRVASLAADAPAHLIAAHLACNRDKTEGRERAADWAAYVEAQGGVYCGRKYAIRLAHEDREGQGRYGDAIAPAIVGVATMGTRRVIDGICDYMDFDRYFAKSTRYTWTMSAGHVATDTAAIKVEDGTRFAWEFRNALGVSLAVARRAAPWTRVTNCTGAVDPDPDLADFPHLFKPWGTLQ